MASELDGWTAEESSSVVTVDAVFPDRSARSPLSIELRVVPFLCLIWIAVSSLLIIRSAIQVRRVSQLLRRADCVNEQLAGITRDAAEQMQVKRSPRVCVVSAQVTPLLWVRWGSPVIVLPQALVEKLTDEQIKCIVCHELAHFVRRDHWSNALAFLVGSLFWWNPVVWWARREMRIAQEACCDAHVIRNSIAIRRSYAETLLQVIEFVGRERPLSPQLASNFGEGLSVRRRFQMIANQRVEYKLPVLARLLVLCVLGAGCCYPVYSQTTADPEQQAENADESGGGTAKEGEEQADSERSTSQTQALKNVRDALELRREELTQKRNDYQRYLSTVVDARRAQAATRANQYEAALARELLNRMIGTFKELRKNKLTGTTSDSEFTNMGRWLGGMRYLEIQRPASAFSILTFDETRSEFRHWHFVNDGRTNEVRGTFEKPDRAGVTIVWTDKLDDGATSISKWTFPASNRPAMLATTTIRDKTGKITTDVESTWTRGSTEASRNAFGAGAAHTDRGALRPINKSGANPTVFGPPPRPLGAARVEVEGEADPSRRVTVSPDGLLVAVLTRVEDHSEIDVFSAASGERLLPTKWKGRVAKVAFSKDSSKLIIDVGDNKQMEYDVHPQRDAERARRQPVETAPPDETDESTDESSASAIKRALPSVVSIHGQEKVDKDGATRPVNRLGSGVVVDSRGYIVTSYTVVEGVTELEVITSDQGIACGRLIDHDNDTDLAIIKIDVNQPLPVIDLGAPDDLTVGEQVIALGNSYGFGRTATRGIISALDRSIHINADRKYTDLIQLDASIHPGNSGGPLLNSDGELIGINVAVRVGAQGIGFAVPSRRALAFAKLVINQQNDRPAAGTILR
jgi:S1-C subfamily serine protease/beta-lactamase regulating signal transducer with metallopeptidase domain